MQTSAQFSEKEPNHTNYQYSVLVVYNIYLPYQKYLFYHTSIDILYTNHPYQIQTSAQFSKKEPNHTNYQYSVLV